MSAPLEYVIIGFPDNDFSGDIAPQLSALIDKGLINIVDLVFVAIGEDGTAVGLEVDEHEHLSAFAALDGQVGGVIGPEDIEHAAESIEAGASVLLIVWEDLWAEPLADALQGAGGVLLEGARIPADVADDVLAAMAETN